MPEAEPQPYTRRWFTHVLGSQIIVSVLTTLTLAMGGFLTGVLPKPAFLTRVDPFNKLDLGALLPIDYRVAEETRIDLDGEGPKEVVVTAVGKPSQTLVPSTVLILAWDRPAGRWTVVFDGAKEDASSSIPSKAIPSERDAGNIQIVFVPNQGGGTDVVMSFNHTIGFLGSNHRVVAVRFRENIARQSYVFDGSGNGGVELAGADLLLRSEWHVIGDGHCCSFRTFTMRLKPREHGYDVVSDDRVGLGIGVVVDDDYLGAVVVDVPPLSPAAGKLMHGDEILNVVGQPVESPSGGSAVFRQIASAPLGQDVSLLIVRNGVENVVRITTVAWRGDAPLGRLLPSLGADLKANYDTDTVTAMNVSGGGPFDRAGISSGSTILSVSDRSPVRPASMLARLWGDSRPLVIRFVAPGGQEKVAEVTPDWAPGRAGRRYSIESL